MLAPARALTIAGVVTALLVAGLLTRAGRTPRPPRNVLLVTLDTMRADRLPSYGFQGYSTPTLERLAAEGLVVEEAFATAPLTLPSHASLMTGLYPSRLGLSDNAGPALKPEVTTIAEALAARGLATSAFLSSGVLDGGRGLEQGFVTYDAGNANGCAGAPPRRRAEQVVDEALAWLETHHERPFFQWVHFYDTHRPYDLPAAYQSAHFDPYLAAIIYEDAQLGRLIDYLDTRAVLDETLVIVVGDHGESLGDHGEESHGIFLYQGSLRVPLIMRGPGVSRDRLRGPASVVDLATTVLPRFGVPAGGLDGIDLLSPVIKETLGSREVYAESMYPLRFGWSSQRALYDGRYKLIDGPRPELYDLNDDPLELDNLAERRAALVNAMRSRLDFYRDAGQTPPPSVPPADMRARLASLGYVSGDAAPPGPATSDAKDPKDYIGVFNEMTTVQWHRAATRREACR